MDTVQTPEPSDTPRSGARVLSSLVALMTCVFRFFKPTLHCDSWIPYVRAMGVLLVLVGTTVVVLVIVYVL